MERALFSHGTIYVMARVGSADGRVASEKKTWQHSTPQLSSSWGVRRDALQIACLFEEIQSLHHEFVSVERHAMAEYEAWSDTQNLI